jgi:alditol oxidase
MTATRTNWAGNIGFPGVLHEPAGLEDLRRLLGSGERLRVVGTGHSFSDVAVPAPGGPAGAQVSLARMPVVRELDTARGLARVSAGLRYGEVAPWLHEHGSALHNLGSLPHIAVAGACSTGTHGSGDRSGILATAVRALRVVTVGGDVLELSRDGEGPGCGSEFAGAVVALGGIGVVTEVTLAVEPTYDVVQTVYDDLPFAAAVEHLDEIMSAAYSVSLFHRWLGDVVDSVWLKTRVDTSGGPADPLPEDVFGARRAVGTQSPIRGGDTDPLTEQGTPGPWHTRLPHFRLGFTPSAGDELQTEYLVPRHRAADALVALRDMESDIAAALLVTEVRSMAADDLWLSGAYGTDAVGVHFTWKPDPQAVLPLLPRIEERLLPLGARPHWGKVFAAAPDAVRPLYPRLDDARRLLAAFDPDGLLSNAFLDAYVRD